MIDFTILEHFGTSNRRLREIFTATVNPDDARKVAGESKEDRKNRLDRFRQTEADLKTRKIFEDEIQSRTYEGANQSLKSWRIYAAVDMAFDSSIINKMNIPLLLYAQGKINVDRAVSLLHGTKAGQECIKKDEKGATYIDLPRLVDTEFNLVRSMILRRWAAQKNKYADLWPFYKYESRSTGLPGKCRADVMSQRADIMADQFGHRAHDQQVVLDAMLYGYQMDFLRSSWEVEQSYRRGKNGEIEPYVAKEGVGWFNPPPAQTAWDTAYPLSSINSDTGCEWLLFWDITKYGDIENNPHYFNKQVIGWSNRFWGQNGIWNTYADYFTSCNYTMIPPTLGNDVNLAAENDRKGQTGVYTGAQKDSAVFKCEYFSKFVPKDRGVGDYPFPVWARFVTASDNTVIFAEFLPSTPAAYLGINGRDSRLVSVSMAMDIIPFQQQMTNLMTQLMLLCQAERFKVYGINTDLLDDAHIKSITEQLKGEGFSDLPLVVPYSLAKLIEQGLKSPENGMNPVTISEARVSQSINVLFEAMIKLSQFVERLVAMSPAESGQPAPREISATEVTEIANTTSSIYSSISNDIDEFRAAKKRIIYESLVACSKSQIECPVKDRYTLKTIRAAGFEPKTGEDEDVRLEAKRFTVIGSPRALVHDFIFTSRDGAERPVNTQAANTLVQQVGLIMSTPPVLQALGKEKLFAIFNEIFRLSGAGFDLNLELKEGEDDSLGQDQIVELQGVVKEMQGYLQKMAGQVQQVAQEVANQEQVNQQQEDAIKGLSALAERVRNTAEHVDELQSKHAEINKRLVESISYKDCPPSIKSQMEMAAGFKPAPMSERVKADNTEKKKAA